MSVIQVLSGFGDASLPVAVAPQSTGLLPSFLNTLTNVSGQVVSALTAVGQAKAALRDVKRKTKGQFNDVAAAWDKNINKTPDLPGSTWIPGIPNGAVIGAGVGLVLLVVLMNRSR